MEHYKRKIVKYGEVPEVVLKCLKKLDHVRVNIELLQVRMFKHAYLLHARNFQTCVYRRQA